MSAPGLHDFQRSVGARIRSGGRTLRPAGVPAAAMARYEGLLFANLRGFLDRCFPVGRACLGEVRWARLCRAFFRNGASESPWFRDIPRAFVAYLRAGDTPPLPRWFAALAHYEWAELAVELMDGEGAAADPDGDLLEGVPVLNPALLSLAFDWPVQHIGPDYRPRRPQPVRLLVYRDATETVCFVELSPATAALLALLELPGGRGRDALAGLAGQMGREADAAFLEFGRHALADLRRLGIILGVQA